MIPVHLQIIAHDLTRLVLREQGDVRAVVTEGAPKISRRNLDTTEFKSESSYLECLSVSYLAGEYRAFLLHRRGTHSFDAGKANSTGDLCRTTLWGHVEHRTWPGRWRFRSPRLRSIFRASAHRAQEALPS
jgi:hypothetical protein